MSYRVIIYGLKSTPDGKTILDYSLNSDEIVISNTLEKLILRIDQKVYTIEKQKWVNTMKVYDTGSKFFIICTKSVSTNYVFETLMKYAVSKLNVRIDFLNTLKESYIKELNSLKLKAA